MTRGARAAHSDLLQSAARELSRIHQARPGPCARLESFGGLREMSRWLDDASARLAKPDAHSAKAAEWLLDNAYLVQRAARRIQQDLPASFYAQLPALSEPAERRPPRVYAIARALLQASRLQIGTNTVVRFVMAYQEHAPLDLSELWALPVMLRLVSIEELTSAFERLEPQLASPLAPLLATPAPTADSQLDNTECIARATRALRAVSDISWADFVSETSLVERTLAGDPTGVFSRMDFETRDRYRDAVETIARGTRFSEFEIARLAVERAERGLQGDADSEPAHVGLWLVGSQQDDFERSVGFRPNAGERIRRGLANRSPLTYWVALSLTTMGALGPPALYLYWVGASVFGWISTIALALLPASMLAVTTVQWWIALTFRPRVLPKLDFSDRIATDCRTAVVIPTLLGGFEEVDHLLERIECHYLCNPDPALRFVLLGDFVDSPSQHTDDDEALAKRAAHGIRRLNARHGSEPEGGRSTCSSVDAATTRVKVVGWVGNASAASWKSSIACSQGRPSQISTCGKGATKPCWTRAS